MKADVLQLWLRLRYAAQPGRAAAPDADGRSYQQAACRRVAAAFGAVPYAASLAARTDAGVAALHNVLSLRVRRPGGWDAAARAAAVAAACRSGSFAALHGPRGGPPDGPPDGPSGGPRDDGLAITALLILPCRVAARAQVGRKHYAYALGTPGADADWTGAARLVAAFAASTYFRAFCARSACHAPKARRARPPLTVQLRRSAAGEATLTVAGQAFLRHQVRCMAQATALVLARVQPVDAFVAALAPPSPAAPDAASGAAGAAFAGPACAPAPAAQLTLVAVDEGPLPGAAAQADGGSGLPTGGGPPGG